MKKCYDCQKQVPERQAKLFASMVNGLGEQLTADEIGRFGDEYVHCQGPDEMFLEEEEGFAVVLCGECFGRMLERVLAQS